MALLLNICKVVPGAGVEPASPCGRGILSPLRIPVSPPGHTSFVSALKKDDKKNVRSGHSFPEKYGRRATSFLQKTSYVRNGGLLSPKKRNHTEHNGLSLEEEHGKPPCPLSEESPPCCPARPHPQDFRAGAAKSPRSPSPCQEKPYLLF